MRTPGLYIAGLGVYLPDTIVTVDEAIARGWCDREILETGYRAVHVAGDMPAPDMAVRAAAQALERSGHQPEDVDLLVHAAAHHQAPVAVAQYVQRQVLRGDALAFGIDHTCNGLVIGLELAATYLLADPARVAALLCAADNFGTPLFDRWRATTGAVFSDLGAAMVLSRRPGVARLLSICSRSAPDLIVLTQEDELFPPSWLRGRPVNLDDRFDRLGTDALAAAARTIRERRAGTVKQALAEADIAVADITRVTHVGSASETALRMMLEPLGMRVEQSSMEWCARNGRAGACDATAQLEDLVSSGAVGSGDAVMMLTNGPGMTFSCAVLQIT